MDVAAPRVLKIVYRATGNSFGGAPPQRFDAALPSLAPGQYLIDVGYRIDQGPAIVNPVVHSAFAHLTVYSTPPTTCSNLSASAMEPMVRAGVVGKAFAPLVVRALDNAGNPISGAKVSFSRVALEDDVAGITDNGADALLSHTDVVTNIDGLALVEATATGHSGQYQYVATVRYQDENKYAYFILRNVSSPGASPSVPVVEYYNSTLDHYFVTTNAVEMAQLDAGVTVGWRRTGAVFGAFDDGYHKSVCRFYGRPEAGLDSHFYSASSSECQEVVARFPESWVLETLSAFEAGLPNPDGVCSEGAPLYRLFNQRADANHRYVTSWVAAQAMVAQRRYVAEGYGAQAVAMCTNP